ncbi:hypothetical protein JTE90_028743 [Oedothorax gibbosus]|uniref:TTF-type domain-containing protein n=1 Tax=Oedothorax gibbosus TaxID=931172 RepID=A0AAV6UGZ2_9ARAC|nr:hypothetical protein JTE90_028743 [Oedothorax gibbosus]
MLTSNEFLFLVSLDWQQEQLLENTDSSNNKAIEKKHGLFVENKDSAHGTPCPGPFQHQLYDIGYAVGKILEDDKKLKFLDETWNPPVNFSFPTKAEGKQNRKFRYEWLQQYKWLAYSEYLEGGFCKMCVLFAPTGAGIGNQILKTFVKEPLSKYKKATEELKYHESTQYHQFSVEKALNFKDTFNSAPGSSKQHISYMLDKKKAAVVEHNRKRLKPIVKTILFCARNNLPLRGHRDDGKMNNEDCLDQWFSTF